MKIVDNLLTGTNLIQEGLKLYHDSKRIVIRASMNWREWVSNSVDLQFLILEQDRKDNVDLKIFGLI